MGIGSLSAFNKGLLMKWRWRFFNRPNQAWVRIIKSIHGENGGYDRYEKKSNCVGVWSKLVGVAIKLDSSNVLMLNTMENECWEG